MKITSLSTISAVLCIFGFLVSIQAQEADRTAATGQQEALGPLDSASEIQLRTLVDREEPTFSLQGEKVTVAALNNMQVDVYAVGDAEDRFYYVPVPLLDTAQMAKDLAQLPASNETLVHEFTVYVDLFNGTVDKEIAAKLSGLKTKSITADMVQLVPANVIEIYADLPMEGTALLTSSPSREVLARGLGSGTSSTIPPRVEGQIAGTKKQLESFLNNPKLFSVAYAKAFKIKQNRVDLGLISASSENFKDRLFGDSNAKEKVSWYQTSSGKSRSKKNYFSGSRKSSLRIKSEGNVDLDRKRWVTRDHIANLVKDELESIEITIWQEFGVNDDKSAEQFISLAFEKLFDYATSSQQAVRAEFKKQTDGTYKLISDVSELQAEFKVVEIQVDRNAQLKLHETEKETQTEKDSSTTAEEGQEVTLGDGLKAVRSGDYFIPTKVDLYQVSEASLNRKLQLTFRHLKAEPDDFTLKTTPASLYAPVKHTAIEMINQEIVNLKARVAKAEDRLNDSIIALDVKMPNERIRKLGNGAYPGILDVQDAGGHQFRYDTWEMLIVGHAFNQMDVSEGTHHRDWKVFPVVQGGVWKIDANVLAHSRDRENWVFRVILIRKDLYTKGK